jgi:Transposase DDE domain group 1
MTPTGCPATRRCAGWSRPGDHWLCCLVQPDGRLEPKWLSRPENLAALADLSGQWIDKVQPRRPPTIIVLDMDPSESPRYGEQEGSAYNRHFGCTCYSEALLLPGECGLRQPQMYKFLEAERISYTIRLQANNVLRRRSAIC